MILVYTGPLDRYNMQRPMKACFDKNVPSYVIDSIAREFPPEFAESSKGVEGRPILIRLPASVELKIQAISILPIIRKLYPTCKMDILGTDGTESLLPGYCRAVDKLSQNYYALYYREFDFSNTNPRARNYYHPAMLATHTSLETDEKGEKVLHGVAAWEMMLPLLNLENSDCQQIAKEGPYEIDTIVPDINKIGVMKSGRRLGSSWPTLYEECKSRNFLEIPNNLSLAIEAIKKCHYIIACGDNPLIYAALWMGRKVMAAVPVPNESNIQRRVDDSAWRRWSGIGRCSTVTINGAKNAKGENVPMSSMVDQIMEMANAANIR